jgi:hypothetical protein
MAEEVVWRPPGGWVLVGRYGIVAMGVLLGGCLMLGWVSMDLDTNVPPTPARALRMFSVILAVAVCVVLSCRSVRFLELFRNGSRESESGTRIR